MTLTPGVIYWVFFSKVAVGITKSFLDSANCDDLPQLDAACVCRFYHFAAFISVCWSSSAYV
jgi:hypothetical protein